MFFGTADVLVVTAAVVVVVFGTSTSTTTSSYEPLRVVFVSGFGPLSPAIQSSFKSATKWLTSAVRVLVDGQSKISVDDVIRASPKYADFTWLFIATESYAGTLRTSDPNAFEVINSANFVVLLQRDEASCKKDASLLASAKPILGDNYERPRMGTMNVCTNSPSWNTFRNAFDLFRHELMHSLGFGTLNPLREEQKAPTTKNIAWKLEQRSTVLFNRTFLDFSGRALDEAREHLGCDDLGGVEAEDEKRIHLSEYVFGNELMTPLLSNSPNYFSFISAAILEQTFYGQKRWYLVDRNWVRAEHDLYWFGRNWGCTFATKSCFEFIALCERASQSPFPFATLTNKRFCLVDKRTKQMLPIGRRKEVERGVEDDVYRSCPLDQRFVDDELPTSFDMMSCDH